ncbi:MAG: hypothetical protein V1659_04500 [Candidatus Woesearchaeota archaeon]
MATFLDVGLVKHAASVFTFILVFVIMYGLMEYKEMFGRDRRSLRGLIAFSVALFVLISPGSSAFIQFITPWFFVLVLIAFLILLVMFMFGEDEAHIKQVVREKEIFWYVFVFIVIIVLFGLGNVFGQGLLSKQPGTADGENASVSETGDTSDAGMIGAAANGKLSPASTSYQQNVVATLFHPKILGFILIMIVALFAIMFLTQPATPN